MIPGIGTTVIARTEMLGATFSADWRQVATCADHRAFAQDPEIASLTVDSHFITDHHLCVTPEV